MVWQQFMKKPEGGPSAYVWRLVTAKASFPGSGVEESYADMATSMNWDWVFYTNTGLMMKEAAPVSLENINLWSSEITFHLSSFPTSPYPSTIYWFTRETDCEKMQKFIYSVYPEEG